MSLAKMIDRFPPEFVREHVRPAAAEVAAQWGPQIIREIAVARENGMSPAAIERQLDAGLARLRKDFAARAGETMAEIVVAEVRREVLDRMAELAARTAERGRA